MDSFVVLVFDRVRPGWIDVFGGNLSETEANELAKEIRGNGERCEVKLAMPAWPIGE